MAYNILTTMSFKLKKSLTEEQLKDNLNSVFGNSDKVYSFIVFNKPDCINVQFNISDNDDYNTIEGTLISDDILNNISLFNDNDKKVICYRQPALDIMVTVYDSFIKKLVKRQVSNWPNLEYDDTYQLCMLTIVELYNKKYYLNKYLISTSFNNAVLVSLRKDKRKPIIVNMEDVAHSGDNDILIKDTICDENAIINEENKENREFMQYVYNELKPIIIDYIGERQFEQLYRDYSNRHTTDSTRKLMYKIKQKLKKDNITWDTFNK